jgi:hypothetical protein
MRRLRYSTHPDYIESQTFTLEGVKAKVRINEKERTMYIVDNLKDTVLHSELGIDLKQLKGLADAFLVANGIKYAEKRKPRGSLQPLKRDQ